MFIAWEKISNFEQRILKITYMAKFCKIRPDAELFMCAK